MANACKDCRHASTAVAHDKSLVLECRRYPPETHLIPTQQGVATMTVQKPVKPDGYCGEFAAKLTLLHS